MCVVSDDHSRVVLNQQDLVTGSDYINASHVDVSFILIPIVAITVVAIARQLIANSSSTIILESNDIINNSHRALRKLEHTLQHKVQWLTQLMTSGG